ncbi:MAG: CAP domain-containing protein [Crocinitomicaceae bacterium]|nr:CAP domain-containing protein [Crocinitomicaceae bacterium]
MRTLLISTLLVFAVSTSWGNQKLYNKLNKLYLTDRNKCLDVSKKIIEKKPTESIPYYFSSVIYYDKSKESRTLKGAYLQLYRSATNAAKFEKTCSDSEKSMVNWDEHIASLKNRAGKLISSLNRNEMGDLSENLTASLNKIESIASGINLAQYDVIENQEPFAFEADVTKVVENTNVIYTVPTNQFFGMPSGKEMILSSNTAEETRLLELINIERAKNGSSPLVWSEDLARACRYHAYDQGSQGYFSHDTYDVSNNKQNKIGGTFDRINKFSKRAVDGECIAAGNSTAEATFQQWMDSPSHRSIILEKSSKTIGIGYQSVDGSPFTHYWVLATGK